MTSHSGGGFFNLAYHDSETLEIDRRFSSKTHHTNPYARQVSGGGRAPPGGPHQDGWRGTERVPMTPLWQHDLDHSTFQIDLDPQQSRSPAAWLPSSMSGKMTVRWRGTSLRRMSMFPNTDPAHAAFTEDAIRSEMENEEQNLVRELVEMSTRDRVRAIRDLPMSFEEKKHIRTRVLAFKSSKKSHRFTCFADCSENVSLSLRRCGYGIKSARQTLELWQGTMKEIGGKFGSSVLSYFRFLKWLLMFNLFSFLVNFGFITIPLLVQDPTPYVPPNVSFRGLEILTGAGYFNHSVMYYGSYSNQTFAGLVEYDMQLAYFFTIAAYMALCMIALIFSMATSFKENYVVADMSVGRAWQLLCSWDFSVTNERAVRQRKNNLRVQLKESLSEKAQKELLTRSEKLKHVGVHLGSWLLSTSLAVGCGASVYFLCQYEQKRVSDVTSWTLRQEAETLLVPFMVSLMNLVVPLFYSLFNKFERYSSHRRQIYALVARNVFLRMLILAVLCYYWMDVVAQQFSCWESQVGQALYRLVIVDFFFLLLGSFCGEFLSNVIGTRWLPHLGVPEFDVARNVLDLIYAQTLGWIGIYFSPLLPVLQILKFFILFYIKKVSLAQNCQPPRRSGRVAQIQTLFILLLFFPFFVGALSVVAYTAWRLTPSEHCGPFRGLNNTFSVVVEWMEDLDQVPGSQWAVWIYEHIIRSEVFYFLITLIILVIIYIFWQVSQGRKELIGLLRQQIVNEGKDKSFLLDKLQNLQRSGHRKPKQKKNKGPTKRRPGDPAPGAPSNSNAMVTALLARQQLEGGEERRSVPGSTSSALMQAMLARQRVQRPDPGPDRHTSSFQHAVAAAEGRESDGYRGPGFSEHLVSRTGAVAQTRQSQDRYGDRGQDHRDRGQDRYGDRGQDRYGDHTDELPSTVSGVMKQVMQARLRAEEDDGGEWLPGRPLDRDRDRDRDLASPGSSALIQAMLARQQAQNEFDDGY